MLKIINYLLSNFYITWMKITHIIVTLFLISCSSETDCCSEPDTCIDENLIDPNKACNKEYKPV